jgi:hypothetical protein
MPGSAHQRPAAVALAFGETVKLQNHVEVIRHIKISMRLRKLAKLNATIG